MCKMFFQVEDYFPFIIKSIPIIERFIELSSTSGHFMGKTRTKIAKFNVRRTGSYIARPAKIKRWTWRAVEQMGWTEQLSNRFVNSKWKKNLEFMLIEMYILRLEQLSARLCAQRSAWSVAIVERTNAAGRRVIEFDICIKQLIKSSFCFSIYPKWEFSHITLPVKNLLELKMHFRDLLRPPIPNWSTQCKRILGQKHAPLCQHALKKGQTPKPLRGELWSYVLGSHNFINVNLFA